MATRHAPNRPVKTADTIFGIIEGLQKLDGAGVTELASYLGLANSTVHDHLATLESKEYVVKEGKKYRLGLKFLDHGIHAKNDLKDLSETVNPVLEQLAAETSEVVWFIVEEHGKAVYVDVVMGENAVPVRCRRGTRRHLHQIAAGKAILAHLDQQRVDEIIERHSLPKKTDRTVTERDHLMSELQTVREQGVAFNDGETIQGLRAVAAPIRSHGEVLGSVSVAGPKNRIRNERFRDEMPELILGGINEIELKLEYF